MKLSRLLLGITAFVALMTGAAKADTVQVYDGDNGQQITLRPGDTLVVNLKANLSTGYSWNIAQNNNSLLRPLGRPTYQQSDSGMMGAPGTQVFRFRAVGSGGEGLTMLYQKASLGGGVRAADTFRLLVVIDRPKSNETVYVTDANNHGNVTLNPGDTLVVQLNANSTTGYQWSVGDMDSSILSLKSSRYIRPRGGMPGQGGTQEFRFTANSVGSLFLGFLYQRPGASGGIPAAQRFEVMVRVRQNLLGSGG